MDKFEAGQIKGGTFRKFSTKIRPQVRFSSQSGVQKSEDALYFEGTLLNRGFVKKSINRVISKGFISSSLTILGHFLQPFEFCLDWS